MVFSGVKLSLLSLGHKGRGHEVVAVRTSLRSVRTATTEDQYSPVRPEQARLVSGLLYGTLFLMVKCNGTLFLRVKCNFKNAL